jgi:cytochrome c
MLIRRPSRSRRSLRPEGASAGSAAAERALIPLLLVGLLLGGCRAEPPPRTAAGGDAERGRLLLRQYACGSCHRIPGVAAARGTFGPPLDALSRQVYLAGVLPNTPDNLVRWIVDPQAIEPGTAMPDMQVSPEQSRDMAAYLYTLK